TSNNSTPISDGGFGSNYSRINRPPNPQHEGGRRVLSKTRSPVNNQDIIIRIASLPRQITDDPLINQFFNGYLF
ncbi:14796_t:CDS:1, partial [Funneliformis mosseae]